MKKNNYIYVILFIIMISIVIFPMGVFALNYDNPCEGEVLKAMKVIGVFITIIKIVIPLLIIIFGMVDFGKAVVSNDDKAISKSSTQLIKRFVAGIAVFFVPTIVLTIMNITGLYDNESSNFAKCTACALDTSKC